MAVAQGVLRTRERLVAILPEGEFLLLNTLRYLHEFRSPEVSELLEKPGKLTPAEIKMAEQLVEQMSGPWDPSGYHDDYREQLLTYIRGKAKAGEARKIYAPEKEEPAPAATRRTDLMSLLKASVGDRTRRSKTA
jgi:DNA end-binding protein Ku